MPVQFGQISTGIAFVLVLVLGQSAAIIIGLLLCLVADCIVTGGWDDNGCRFVSATASGQVTCQCNHLTNFACLVVSGTIVYVLCNGHNCLMNNLFSLSSYNNKNGIEQEIWHLLLGYDVTMHCAD